MSKNATIIILNDLKKNRDSLETKYSKQKNKRATVKEKLIYILGFVALFIVACMFYPSSLTKVALSLAGYTLGVPFIYSYIEFSKEQKLKRELDKLNKTIEKLEFELNETQVKHQCINETKQFIVENKPNNHKPYIPTYNEEELIEEGAKLRLHK